MSTELIIKTPASTVAATDDDMDNADLRFFMNDGATKTFTKRQLRKALFSTVINVADFGADPNGVADATDQIQEAIDACAVENAVLYIPVGQYKISDTLVYTGSSSGGILIQGEGNGPRSGAEGAALVWAGADDGIVLHLWGANKTRIQSLGISPAGGKTYKGGIFVQEHNSTGGSGSSGVSIRDVTVIGGTGANSYGIRLGDNNYQVSEIDLTRVDIAGGGDIGDTVYGLVTATSNTKDFGCYGCSFVYCQYGIAPAGGGGNSGFFKVSTSTFGANSVADIWCSSGSLDVDNCNSEGSSRLITGTGGANMFALTVQHTQFSGPCTDDIVIAVGFPQLRLIGNNLVNTTGTEEAKVVVNSGSFNSASTNQITAIESFGNFFSGVTTGLVPFYTQDGDGVANINGAVVGKRAPVISLGDRTGTAGTLTPLHAVLGVAPYIPEASPYGYSLGVAGITYRASVPYRTTSKVTLSYTAFKANALNQTILVFQLQPKMQIVSVIAETTQAFAGLSGTIRLAVGTSGLGEDFLLTHDVKSGTTTKGIAEADLGTLMVRSALVQGAYAPWSGSDVYVSLWSGTGAIGNGTVTNLSAGSVTVYLVTERIG